MECVVKFTSSSFEQNIFVFCFLVLLSINIFLCLVYIIREDATLFQLITTFRYSFNLLYLVIVTCFIFININESQIPANRNRYSAVVNETMVLFVFCLTWFMSLLWYYMLKYIDYEVFIQKKQQTKNIIQLIKTNINNINIKEINDLILYNINNYKLFLEHFNLVFFQKLYFFQSTA